jgi:hypothetical protein
VVTSQTLSVSQKALFLWSLLGAITTNYSILTAWLLIIIALLSGLNIAVSTYYFKQRLAFQKAYGVSLLGMLAGFIGIGCASCGSIFLATLIGVGATASVTGAMPLQGQEFTILSILLLIGTLYYTAKKAGDPLVCGIKLRKA